jgi:hypothetical protein
MPKAKAPRRSASKASRKRAPAKAKPSKAKPSAAKARARKATIDPRVIAAIGLALHAEKAASDRVQTLAQPLSPWVALGRARAVRTS